MPPLHPQHAEGWARFKDGTLQDYKPYIRVKDVKRSKGSGHREFGLKTGRVHHMLSKIEFNYFLILDSSPVVVDIREQYPLNPEETWRIAWELGIPHHEHPDGGLVVPTLDFLITSIQEGKPVLKARDLKAAVEISDKRTLAKLEITRRYCALHQIDYAICTDEDIPAILARNLAEMRLNVNLEGFNLPTQVVSDVRYYLEERLPVSDCLSDLAITCDRALGRKDGQSLVIAQYLLMTGAWQLDLTQPFHPATTGICKTITPIYHDAVHRNVA